MTDMQPASWRQPVHVIDDEAAIRSVVKALLTDAGFEVATYCSAEAFVEAYSPHSRGCIVLDLYLEGMGGRDLQRWLNGNAVRLPIIFITGNGDISTAVAALRDGALDFIQKPIDTPRLVEAVRTALLAEEKDYQRRTQIASIDERLATLTQGEREVLDGLVNGQTYKNLAEELDVSYKTIEARRARVLKKMQAKSISELIRMMLVSYVSTSAA